MCRLSLIFAACSFLTFGLLADGEAKKDRSLNDLSLEIHALHIIHQLQLKKPQLETILALSKETVERSGARKAVKANEEFQKVATSLRTALLEGTDEDKIDDLTGKMLDLRDKEKLDIDDAVEITDEARKAAPGLLKKLSPRQVALFSAGISDILNDPNEVLLAALEKVRGLDEKEWRATRDSVSDQVGHLLGGLDDAKFDAVADKVTQLLITVRALEDNEFKKRKEELEKKARELVGNVGPTDILRNVVERAIAEMLSNPQLPAACQAKLERLKKEEAKK